MILNCVSSPRFAREKHGGMDAFMPRHLTDGFGLYTWAIAIDASRVPRILPSRSSASVPSVSSATVPSWCWCCKVERVKTLIGRVPDSSRAPISKVGQPGSSEPKASCEVLSTGGRLQARARAILQIIGAISKGPLGLVCPHTRRGSAPFFFIIIPPWRMED